MADEIWFLKINLIAKNRIFQEFQLVITPAPGQLKKSEYAEVTLSNHRSNPQKIFEIEKLFFLMGFYKKICPRAVCRGKGLYSKNLLHQYIFLVCLF